MDKIVEWTPAFDKRDPDPRKSCGIHSVTLRFVLKGKHGAIQFLIFTGWHLPHVQKEIEKNQMAIHYSILSPLPADLGCHSKTPQYEGQEPIDNNCPFTEGVCYYDGSGLSARDLFNQFVEKGESVVWEKLEEEYILYFGKLE